MKTNSNILEIVLQDIENNNFEKYERHRREIQRKLKTTDYMNSEHYYKNELQKARILFYINSVYIDMELLNDKKLNPDLRTHIEKDAEKYIKFIIKAAESGEIQSIKDII